MTWEAVTWLGKQSHVLGSSHMTWEAVTWLEKQSHDLGRSHMTWEAVTWLGKKSHDLRSSHMTWEAVTWLEKQSNWETVTWLEKQSHDLRNSHMIEKQSHDLRNSHMTWEAVTWLRNSHVTGHMKYTLMHVLGNLIVATCKRALGGRNWPSTGCIWWPKEEEGRIVCCKSPHCHSTMPPQILEEEEIERRIHYSISARFLSCLYSNHLAKFFTC